ncbi:UDP-N-acetylmuramate:L-alanyl-gamma-D-glutamyl-meso-diaminopimelate ligase [Aquisalimonas lutea]|uniref:UDP-N-acetylmuramate:L-alanyl-gamma-D-glutamyl- meso-diaminopimelate ligase n=1 Tax=Aquisalimonas lutea TaxID=1327750 RepID=UPI0025B5584E|nr:UDP-N-acetylmuramate:L-alanyl-gamma-D-glutamyl-meso-diaminopimelate ligase [Aquisalimonas lutea]MDN3516064.1 UDP-N-acetylmuramate:L-alanyl-gamma-D-glutamyl-meso-diaminopimelate ligase [Aquisalimonas lutea]
MHIHILGICGTFMGSLALLAREAGHRVTGSDRGIYPPMSDLLAAQGIPVGPDDDPEQLVPAPDCVIIGNALSRGHPLVEAVLDRRIPYTSGPQWLADNLLRDRWVIAVSGTHGKTTTAGLTAWLLEDAGLAPGFLIGGVPGNFDVSARLGASPFFVIEADEYDSAFFDKRSKFVHFRPDTLVVNNLEFDHADIFPDLDAIQRQFHHLVRTVPGRGRIIAPQDDPGVRDMLAMGCWSELEAMDDPQGWHVEPQGAGFRVMAGDRAQGELNWSLAGVHNARNALAALLAARHAGVPVAQGLASLAGFRGMRRRQELRGTVNGIRVVDDFAHHPTAIRATLEALRPAGRLLAVLEPRSNTMRLGAQRAALPGALAPAQRAFLYQPPGLDWSVAEVSDAMAGTGAWSDDLAELVERIAAEARPGDQIVVMSNGSFGGIHQRLLDALASRHHAPIEVPA